MTDEHEETYRHHQLWPFGTGALMIGHAVAEHVGLLQIMAVHDDATGDPEVDMAWVKEHGGPGTTLSFATPESIDNLIDKLTVLRAEMIVAREK